MEYVLERAADGRERAFRKALGVSLGAHAVVLLLLVVSPDFGSDPVGLPGVMSVDLVAALPGPAGAPAPPAPPPAPVAKPELPPQPVPEPIPAPPPPPVVDQVVLPEESTKVPKPKPKPKPEPKAELKPKPEPAPKPEPVAYEDALAQLRSEAGEEIEYDDALERLRAEAGARPTQVAAVAPGGGGGGSPGTLSAEEAAWRRKAKIHVTRAWVLAPGLRSQPLETEVRVKLSALGDVLDVDVVDRSGNPWFDDSVVRAIEKASPLPAPPEPEHWRFVFSPQDLL